MGGRWLSQNGMHSPAGGPQRGPLLLACICAAWYNNPQAASLASAACGGVDPFGVPSLPPCPRSPGSWVLGPGSRRPCLCRATHPSRKPVAHGSVGVAMHLHSTPNANTHEVSDSNDTSMPAWATVTHLPGWLLCRRAMIPELWFLTVASRIRQSIVHQVGC